MQGYPKELDFVRPLETKRLEEALLAIQSVVNQASALVRCKSVTRIHGDKASELTGEKVEQHFADRGSIATNTGGCGPNANPRADGGGA